MLFLKNANFTLPGGFTINPYNVQGFILMGVWATVLLIVLLFYHDAGLGNSTEIQESKGWASNDYKMITV